MHILFGADIDDSKIVINARSDTFGVYVPKELTLSEAIEESFEISLESIRNRSINPLWSLLYSMTGKCHSFTYVEKVSDANNETVRETIRKYVRKRASGEAKSDLAGDSDVLTLMMQNSDVFKEDDIIDELMDFMVAGSQTTQLTS